MFTKKTRRVRIQSILAPLGIASATLVGSATPSSAMPVISRHIQGTIEMHIMDHESVESNVHCFLNQFPNFTMTNQSGVWGFIMIGHCGGEVRVELTHNYEVNDSGVFEINGRIRLFEGTDPATTQDLDGWVDPYLTVGVPAGHWTTVREVHNDLEGGDHAWITFDLTNSAA